VIPVKHFYMIRHGQTVANVAQLMAGSTDSPLTETGRAQAESVRAIVKNLTVKPSLVVHSNLSRARDTATIINESLNAPLIEEPDLAEMHAGDWEGVSYDMCRTMLIDWRDPPGGETFEQFSGRIAAAKRRIFSRNETSPLIVSHGGVFRGFARLYDLHIPVIENCRLFEFDPIPEIHDSGHEPSRVFPWRVYSYDAWTPSVRTPVDIFSQAAFAIAR
jgi:broad specificity phosphatase PhoE